MPDDQNKQNEKLPQAAKDDVRDKLIAHLTEEITTLMTGRFTFRNRLGFSILLGPFVVLSSVLFWKDGNLPEINNWDENCNIAAGFAMAAYGLLAVFGGFVELNMNRQTNKLHETLIKVAHNETIKASDLEYDQRFLVYCWIFSFVLILLAFGALLYLLFQM